MLRLRPMREEDQRKQAGVYGLMSRCSTNRGQIFAGLVLSAPPLVIA
jgi:hypothetical protein